MSDYDTINVDGKIDKAELAAAWDWTEDKAQSHIDDVDMDDDGLINSSEFEMVLSMVESGYLQHEAWFLFHYVSDMTPAY